MTARRAMRLPETADLGGGQHLSGGIHKPALLLVVSGGRRFAVKDVRDLPWPRRLLWRWLLRREARAYRALEGLQGLPLCYGMLDRDALLLAYLEGEVVRRESTARQRPDFFRRLEAIVEAMHARGWVHLDLGHRRNVLVLDDGNPAVLDLGASQPWAKLPILGRIGRWVDLRAVRRLERRYKRQGFASRKVAS